ncbi:thiol reductant ABC exporter subunit CydC [Schaalia canis]|uniref:Thiol reductant ABC exporter subunit CydC n=1 Tax=Schaalia canis TaxID=100469 RepID=A0A3P1SHF8_9ACTO|nr:thiol reductant ABC exporter subunit CydC [Schaalia canis]RRC96359.1 thiol reductant ABC exporter subunit CydC [Schaalia canis]
MTLFLTPVERKALRRVLSLLDVDRRGFALSVLLGVVGLGSSIALAATSAWLIARASQHPPVLYLTVAATSVRMFGVLRALMRYLQRLASHKVALAGMDSLRYSLYTHLANGPVNRVAQLQRGDLLARTGADVDAVGDFVVKALLPTVVAAIVGTGTVIGLSVISPAAGMILALCLLLSGVIAPLLTMRSARIAELSTQEARTRMSETVLSVMEGASELAISGKLPRVHEQLATHEAEINRATREAGRVAGIAAGIDRLAMGLAVVGALIVGIPDTVGGQIAAVSLAVLALTPLASFEGTAELAPAAVQLVRSAGAAVRIDELLGDDTPIPTHPLPPSSNGPIVTADNLAIGWPGGPTIAEGISLQLAPGSATAIVGPSGVGKTTLLFTLAGMIPPHSGSLTIDGVDLWGAEREALTERLTMTAEDAHVFATTVIENLRVANPSLNEADALELLHAVGLTQWVSELPSGLETLLGSGGTTVSGGERRRLLMARALAAPSPLLVLDEASEHLDSQMADTLMRTLFERSRTDKRGILIVSHRLSALDAADTVMVFAPGTDGKPARVTDIGTHEELYERSEAYRWAREQEA